MTSSTFTEALATFESAIVREAFDGYGLLAIPHALDGTVEQVVNSYVSAVQEERSLVAYLPPQAVNVLRAFAERRSAQAVRENAREQLESALVAVGLAIAVSDDEREGMSVLPLPWHTAKQLALEPHAVFQQASDLLPSAARHALLAFCRRRPEDQTLACMGYTSGADEGGFRYVRNW